MGIYHFAKDIATPSIPGLVLSLIIDGTINVGREGIPQKRNVKKCSIHLKIIIIITIICTSLRPTATTILVKPHTLLALSQGQEATSYCPLHSFIIWILVFKFIYIFQSFWVLTFFHFDHYKLLCSLDTTLLLSGNLLIFSVTRLPVLTYLLPSSTTHVSVEPWLLQTESEATI